MNPRVFVTGAVEGPVDEAVLRRLVSHVGSGVHRVHGKNGKAALLRSLNGYNYAAERSPWVVLVDLDNDPECPPEFRRKWLPQPARWMCFRVAVRAVEASLLADREGIARFLRVSSALVPRDPESVPYPKRVLIELAARSRSSVIRQDLVPRPGSGREVGPAYTSRMTEFALYVWRPEVAEGSSESLRRALVCLRRLVASAEPVR